MDVLSVAIHGSEESKQPFLEAVFGSVIGSVLDQYLVSFGPVLGPAPYHFSKTILVSLENALSAYWSISVFAWYIADLLRPPASQILKDSKGF